MKDGRQLYCAGVGVEVSPQHSKKESRSKIWLGPILPIPLTSCGASYFTSMNFFLGFSSGSNVSFCLEVRMEQN